MSRILPDWFVGSMVGFLLVTFGAGGLWDVLLPARPGNQSEVGLLLVGLVGAMFGGIVGWLRQRPAEKGGTVARWCIGMTALLGGVGFLAGPLLLPLRLNVPKALPGLFFTGPLGALAGAILGLVIGLVRQPWGGRPGAGEGTA